MDAKTPFRQKGFLSVVIPAYNEEAMILKTASVIAGILNGAQIEYELLFVDDGSGDNTWPLIQQASAENPCVRGLSFSRNFGKDKAIFAGLSYAAGDVCAVIDCDLQHPPEKIVEMFRLWEQGWQVVEGVKSDRGRGPRFHALCARVFYAVISRAAGIDMRRSSDFKLLDRKVVDVLLEMREQDAFFRALSSWVGFRRTAVEFRVNERAAGESKWSFKALVRYAVSSITSFSAAPLQFSTAVGVLVLAATLVSAAAFGIFGGDKEAWLLFFAVLGLMALGCLLVGLGILGYYADKIYQQTLNRPRFIIADECGKKNEKSCRHDE